jgi:hypothetical protein
LLFLFSLSISTFVFISAFVFVAFCTSLLCLSIYFKSISVSGSFGRIWFSFNNLLRFSQYQDKFSDNCSLPSFSIFPKTIIKNFQIGPHSINCDDQLAKPLNRETVYIEKSIAESFGLQNFKDVVVTQARD